jgi:hypothetical protein
VDDALGTNGEQVVDASWGYVNDNYGPCYLHDPSFSSEWDTNSVESGGINYVWPTTQVHFIVGGNDTQGIRDNATALFNVLTANGTAATYQIVPNMGHAIADSKDWLDALFTVLTAAPTPTPTPTILVTFQTNPGGLAFAVDGITYTSTQTFSWTPGSNHTIATTSPQSGGTGVRYWWNRWSDGKPISHNISPTKNVTYTATLTKQYNLVMRAGTGGKVSPPSGWKNSGATV